MLWGVRCMLRMNGGGIGTSGDKAHGYDVYHCELDHML